MQGLGYRKFYSENSQECEVAILRNSKILMKRHLYQNSYHLAASLSPLEAFRIAFILKGPRKYQFK